MYNRNSQEECQHHRALSSHITSLAHSASHTCYSLGLVILNIIFLLRLLKDIYKFVFLVLYDSGGIFSNIKDSCTFNDEIILSLKMKMSNQTPILKTRK